MIGRKRLAGLAGAVIALGLVAGGGAAAASALGDGSSSQLLKGRLDAKVKPHALTKAQRQKLRVLATAKVRTPAQARQLMRALGVNPKGYVIQLGKRNYAGPKCPGRGWSCTTARRVFQAAGDNDFECTPGSGTTASPPNSCEIIQANGGTARCIERTKVSLGVPITQECAITQGVNATGDNRADIVQVAYQTDDGTAIQDVTQHAFVMQTNGANSNRSSIRQDVKQSIGKGSTPAIVKQNQNAHQRVFVTQITDNGTDQAGDNDSKVDQSQDQSATAGPAATEIIQKQNADEDFDTENCPTFSFLDDAFANQCAAVVQLSNATPTDPAEFAIPGPGGGKNDSQLQQRLNQSQNARKTPDGLQGQGSGDPTIGGLDHRFIQHSTGVSRQDSHQHENQSQHRSDTGAMTSYQHGPTRKGTGVQSDNPGNVANQNQNSKQQSNGPGAIETTNVMTDQCQTSGNCDADQMVDSNGNKAHNRQSGQFFIAFIACGGVDIFPGGGDFSFLRLTQEVPPCESGDASTTIG